ncbi:hypothetical protein N7470_003625 [Penicillium chermesinum]|nr:hypothetical protein N7470_003625 [Penicillium chermesinum]
MSLHAPEAHFNLIGRPLLEEYQVTTHNGGETPSYISRISDGETVAFFKPLGTNITEFELQLNCHRRFYETGHPPLPPYEVNILQAYWPAKEQENVEATLQRILPIQRPINQTHGKFFQDRG